MMLLLYSLGGEGVVLLVGKIVLVREGGVQRKEGRKDRRKKFYERCKLC